MGYSFIYLYLVFIFPIWMVLLLLVSGDIESNPGPQLQNRCVRLLYANVRGLHANIRGLTVASAQYDVLMCSETLVSNRHHLSELRICFFGSAAETER